VARGERKRGRGKSELGRAAQVFVTVVEIYEKSITGKIR